MPFRAAKLCAKKVLRAVPRNGDSHGTTPETENIHGVVLHTLAGREVIVTERRSSAADLIRSYRGSHAATAYKNATFYFTTCHRTCERNREIRVIIVLVIYLVAEVDYLVASFRQQLRQLLLHLEAAVIGAYAHSHDVLPLVARFVQRNLILRCCYDVVHAEAELLQ